MEDLAITFAQLTIRRPPDRPKGTFSRFELLTEDVIRIIFANFVPKGTLRPRDQRYLTSNIFPDITATSVRELRKCLQALCLTSKRFYTIAHPLFYRVLIIKTHYEMALLFRTFSATPRLRSLVKTFAWVPDRFTPPTLQDEIESFSEENKMFAIQRDVGLHWPVSPADLECARQLPQGCQLPWSSEAVFTAILGMLTHIKTLCVVSGWREFPDAAPGIIGPDWVASSLQNLLGGDRGATFGFLQKLEVFSMENKKDFNSGDRGSFYLATQLVLRACPKLRRVEYMAKMDEMKNDYRFSSQGFNFLLGPHHPLSTSVEEVVVAFGTSPMAELPRILRSLPNLKVLRGEYCVTTADTDSTQHHATSVQETNTAGSWNDTILALFEVRDTLQELHLTTRRETSWRGWDRRARGSQWPQIDAPRLGLVLPQMSALTSLTIEIMSLFDFTHHLIKPPSLPIPRISFFLPPSLKTLHLVDYWGVGWRIVYSRRIEWRSLVSYQTPSVHCGLNTHASFWRSIVTDMIEQITDTPAVALRELRFSSPEYEFIRKCLGSERIPDTWDGIDDPFFEEVYDPTWDGPEGPYGFLFHRSEQVGLKLIVQDVEAFTSIPKKEWTCLEGYLD